MKDRRVPLREFFLSTIAQCPPLAQRLNGAVLSTGVEATGNFSYACDRCYGDNFLMIGDAFAFIDPVFSSGVMLAMVGGAPPRDAADVCLRDPARKAGALRRFDKAHAPRSQAILLVHLPRHQPRRCASCSLGPRNVLRMEEALLSLLAGDVFGRTPIWASLFLFKCLYYLICLANLRRTLRAMRSRAVNIRAEPESLTGD